MKKPKLLLLFLCVGVLLMLCCICTLFTGIYAYVESEAPHKAFEINSHNIEFVAENNLKSITMDSKTTSTQAVTIPDPENQNETFTYTSEIDQNMDTKIDYVKKIVTSQVTQTSLITSPQGETAKDTNDFETEEPLEEYKERTYADDLWTEISRKREYEVEEVELDGILVWKFTIEKLSNDKLKNYIKQIFECNIKENNPENVIVSDIEVTLSDDFSIDYVFYISREDFTTVRVDESLNGSISTKMIYGMDIYESYIGSGKLFTMIIKTSETTTEFYIDYELTTPGPSNKFTMIIL